MKGSRGRRARRYPCTVEEAQSILRYDPLTGEMVTLDLYNIKARRGKDGYNLIRLPVSMEHSERGSRLMADFRVDHLAWYITMGYWPDGWIEHVNDLHSDDSLDNLVFLDLEDRRWWFGAEVAGGAPMLVEIETARNANGYAGPLLYEQRMDNGTVKWMPVVAEAHRLSTAGGTKLDEIEDDAYPKGEFGLDWGVIERRT